MPSARAKLSSRRPPLARSGAVAACAVLLAGAGTGCSTTQEKAERQQARAQHILDARKQRQNKKHHNSKQHQAKDKNGGNG